MIVRLLSGTLAQSRLEPNIGWSDDSTQRTVQVSKTLQRPSHVRNVRRTIWRR